MALLRNSKIVLDICDQVVDLQGQAREEFVERACVGDDALRQSVTSLLQAIEDSGSFLQIGESNRKDCDPD